MITYLKMQNSGTNETNDPFAKLQGILQKQTIRPMKVTRSTKAQQKRKMEADEAHKYFIKNIEQQVASKKMFNNQERGGNWQDLLSKTPKEPKLTQQKGKVGTAVGRDVNTVRTLIPNENKEVEKKMPKKKIFEEEKNKKSYLYGQGKDHMTLRYEKAKNRRINTLKNFQENEEGWSKHTKKIMKEIAQGSDDYKTPKKKGKKVVSDPRLKAKIQKMEEGKVKLKTIMENSPITGGPKRKKKTVKKFNQYSKKNRRSDIYFNGKTCIDKEKEEVRGRKRRPSRQDADTNKNGFLDKFKDERDSTAPFLHPIHLGKTSKKRRRPCKRQHPIKNVSYGLMGCIEQKNTAKKNRIARRTSSISEVSNTSAARQTFQKQMRSSIFF